MQKSPRRPWSCLVLGVVATACGKTGNAGTEFSAVNADKSVSILHHVSAVKAGEPAKFGQGCWYRAKMPPVVEEGKEPRPYDTGALEYFNPDQQITFLMQHSVDGLLTKYPVNCEEVVAAALKRYPGKDFSSVCANNTGVTLEEAQVAFRKRQSQSSLSLAPSLAKRFSARPLPG